MFFSRMSLLFVLIEWGCIAYGFLMPSAKILYHMFIYGSPLYMAFNFFQLDSILHERMAFIIGLVVFHLLKYACIFKAKASEDDNGGLMIAILLEVAYIGYSGYLLY